MHVCYANLCNSNPCNNGGICKNGICECPNDCSGKYCERCFDAQEDCCREKGVADVCLGYCQKTLSSNEPRRGICYNWFDEIGQCRGGT